MNEDDKMFGRRGCFSFLIGWHQPIKKTLSTASREKGSFVPDDDRLFRQLQTCFRFAWVGGKRFRDFNE